MRSLLTQQSIAVVVLPLNLSKWSLGNAEYAWIRKCALQSLTLSRQHWKVKGNSWRQELPWCIEEQWYMVRGKQGAPSLVMQSYE